MLTLWKAFRDRATGRNYNRDQPAEGAGQDHPTRERGARRGGRGPRGARRGGEFGDRQSRTGQVEHGWGENTGEGEWADEKAGEVIAKEEEKEGWNQNAEPATEGAEAGADGEGEPENTGKSYAEYLAEQAAKKLEGLGLKEARAPNEGAKEDKKWKAAKELTKDETEDYFKGEERVKAQRERASKKQVLDIDYSFKEPPRETRGRGGRGGVRGRGDRPDRPERGDFGGRGRGDRPDRPDRGDFRGRGRGGRGRGRGGDGPVVPVHDESAFPSLGGK
ncbi:hypothetical protein A1O3_02105 [Capronia epimyces CBS 606.96]|uniref:Hyaluronan/mRNA-binding protein domain-containing protein n=1 Tax=Capronia epimyces CBS 606.96 TaxID=1182542 RepID=W9YIG0_9EURO|nr:uncharacterized protein A1O3_02105 [Capronia epimyces CBS 606.96]EXJ89041.1 hypothetical protein A1O3_02105 [Capronia epimyces CBS 606.96]